MNRKLYHNLKQNIHRYPAEKCHTLGCCKVENHKPDETVELEFIDFAFPVFMGAALFVVLIVIAALI